MRIADASSEGLRKLLRACNEIAQSFGQPGLYGDWQGSRNRQGLRGDTSNSSISGLGAIKSKQNGKDPFHISIGWALSRPPQEDLHEQDMAMLALHVKEVKAKIGSDVTSLKLSSEKAVTKDGLF